MRNLIWIVPCLLLSGMVVGCGKAPIPKYPVSGRVTIDGKPLHKGDVVFVPDAEKGNAHLQFAMGKLGADGTYTTQTFEQTGVQPGWYKVMILAFENEPQDSLSWVPIWLVPEKYGKAETSGLSVEVVAEPAAGAFDFKLVR